MWKLEDHEGIKNDFGCKSNINRENKATVERRIQIELAKNDEANNS